MKGVSRSKIFRDLIVKVEERINLEIFTQSENKFNHKISELQEIQHKIFHQQNIHIKSALHPIFSRVKDL